MRYAILWALRVSSDLTENATRAKGSHKMMNNNNIGRVAPLLFALLCVGWAVTIGVECFYPHRCSGPKTTTTPGHSRRTSSTH